MEYAHWILIACNKRDGWKYIWPDFQKHCLTKKKLIYSKYFVVAIVDKLGWEIVKLFGNVCF